MKLSVSAGRLVIVLLAIAVLAVAFENMGKPHEYALRYSVCTAWSKPQPTSTVPPGLTAAPLDPWGVRIDRGGLCVNSVKRFYPWVISFSLIAVAVIAAAGAVWVVNERRT